MKIPSTATPDVQQSFREVYLALDPWAGGQNIDLKGRRLMNAGAAVADSDYVTLGELRAQVQGPLAAITAGVQADANRLIGVTLAPNVVNSSLRNFGVLNANLLFTDATYDIGQSGATRPRHVYASANGVFGGIVTAGAGMGIAANTRLYFDGVAMTGNTYMAETSADQLDCQVGGARLWVGYSGAMEVGSGRDLIVASGKRIFVDGGGNTYLFESSADNLRVIAGGSGGVELTSGATAWTAVSDEREKTDFKPIEHASDMVEGWRTVTGRYLTDAPSKRRVFLIAQDVQRGLPEAVSEVEGRLRLAMTDTVPVLVAALKEHANRLRALEARH